MLPIVSEKLSHLSQAQVNELIRRYYSNEKIADLIKEYAIKVQPSQLVKEFPANIHEIICEYCSHNMVSYYQSKNSHPSESEPKCPNCGHIDSDSCYCKNCRANAAAIQQKQIAVQREYIKGYIHSLNISSVSLRDLSFEEKVYLGAFVREGISEDFNYINPIETFINPLAPTQRLQDEILVSLSRSKRLLVLSPHSDINCFPDLEVSSGNLSYYPTMVKWSLNVIEDGINKVPLVEKVMNPSEEYGAEEQYMLWRKIALEESIEYLVFSIKNVLKTDYTVGEKTVAVLSDILNNFSVSQVYGIIYSATNNALRFKAERMVSGKHAANTVIGYAQSHADKAIAGSWDLKKYGRRDCPQSAVSKFFFERILKNGSDGFYTKPELKE